MKRRSRRNEIQVGALLLLAAVVFTWLSIQVGSLKTLGDVVRVDVVLDDAAGLVEDSAVRVSGVQVGWVDTLTLEGSQARVGLVLKREAALRSDVQARVRARSLLGEKYLHLSPRSTDAPLLVDGDVITDTVPAMEIDEVITMLGPLLSRVDPDDMATLITDVAALAEAARGDGVAALADLRSILAKVDAVADEAPALVDDTGRVLHKVEDAVDDASAMARDARDLVPRVGETLDQVDAAVAPVPDAVADVRRIAAELEPGLSDLGTALQGSDEAMADLKKILRNLSGLDEQAIERLLREEGVLIRLKPKKID